MALSNIETLKPTNNPLIQGVMENIGTSDQLVANLPMQPIRGKSMDFNREKALPTTSKPSPGATITATDALAFSRVSSYCRSLVIDQAVGVLDAANYGMSQAKAIAISKAAKSIGRSFGDDIITGNANWTVTVVDVGSSGASGATIVVGPGHDPTLGPGLVKYTHSGTTVQYKAPGDAEFGAAVSYATAVKVYSSNEDKWVQVTLAGTLSANGTTVFTFAATSSSTEIDGLLRLVTSGQTISSSGTNGDAIALATLDQLADLVKVGMNKAYVMNSRTRRSVMALLRALGGVGMMEVTREYAPQLKESVVVPSYNGLPIFTTDFAPLNRAKGSLSNGAVVFCASLDANEGVHGFYSQSADGDELSHELIASENGITVLNLGTDSTTDTQKVRVKMYAGLAVKSDLAIAMADEITN